MKTWRRKFSVLLHWLQWPRGSEPLPACEIALVEEIEALLDLMLYTAAQTVAHAKRLERQFDQSKQNPRLAEELIAVEREAEQLRRSIERIQDLLKTARSRAMLWDSQTAYEEASQLQRELMNPRDLDELQAAIFSKND